MMIIRVNIIIYLMLYFLGTECELMLLNDTNYVLIIFLIPGIKKIINT